ncbi:hypothetical protein SAMN05444392_10373 [Seinonella peptonophila]|uniref:Uncharacterized protein n=1 Tax=Seinonella peptonophila TaxID=112248 RepID=A0A1M4W7B1_9BACL|nr:hypothetical protein [Seinonella peptonophila]SHE77106.1 hypothetical protein SAMN05444392_10373 [Seinonella peptonophila]
MNKQHDDNVTRWRKEAKERDQQLAKEGKPLGEAVDENRQNKRSGENRPAT